MKTTLTPQATQSKPLPPVDAKARVSQFMRQLQDDICQVLQQLDGEGTFHEDAWERPEGGGGRSRIIRDGAVFEQSGVNFSEVWGSHLPPSIFAQRPEADGHQFFLCHRNFNGIASAQSLCANCSSQLPLL